VLVEGGGVAGSSTWAWKTGKDRCPSTPEVTQGQRLGYIEGFPDGQVLSDGAAPT